jgi:hypothetical protein
MPMVVGSGLEEDVCEMKETWSASGKPATSQGQMITKRGWHPILFPPGKQDLPDPIIRWSEV